MIEIRIDLIKQHHILEVNSNPHKNNLALRILSPGDHVIVRRFESKQKWQHGKVSLIELTLNNSSRKWYPTRNRKPVIRYGFEDK